MKMAMLSVVEGKRKCQGLIGQGSCPKNIRNILNLLEQGSRPHFSNFMYLHLNQAHVLLRNILMCTLDNLTYPVRNSMRVHHRPKLRKSHKRAGASML
ncbi:hypothetical protein E2C01_039025 [Portunus trituberculatus]|uniref:Uncharacterized protein n=1 Tax=Portunus trituberculatus TaxID=210409 RepID=A0A5B7FJI7_PORTR|nr:hypothetical protein [Portunus trituberculatus]